MAMDLLSIQSKLPSTGVSIFSVMSRLAEEHGAINLSQGFPDFDCAPELVEAVARCMREGHNQYAPMLGIFALTVESVQGALMVMIGHGLSTGALFLLVGMLYERRHSRLIADFGGLWAIMPVFSALLLVVTFSSVGLPGLNGFVGEFLILLGAFQWSRPAAVLGTAGIVFAAVYLLWMYQRVIFGAVRHEENRRLPDLDAREVWTLVPILLLIVWIGVYPKPFTAVTERAVADLLQVVQEKRAAAPAPWRVAVDSLSR